MKKELRITLETMELVCFVITAVRRDIPNIGWNDNYDARA
jgi:hypothetical protein